MLTKMAGSQKSKSGDTKGKKKKSKGVAFKNISDSDDNIAESHKAVQRRQTKVMHLKNQKSKKSITDKKNNRKTLKDVIFKQ